MKRLLNRLWVTTVTFFIFALVLFVAAAVGYVPHDIGTIGLTMLGVTVVYAFVIAATVNGRRS